MKKLCRILAALLFALCAVSCKHAADNVRCLPEEIVHAGGRLWGRDAQGVYRSYDGANALEGLLLCTANGASAVELDFSFTADGALVCLHHWSGMYAQGMESGVPLTQDAFCRLQIYGQFTPLTLADAAVFFRMHPEMVLVTDIKENFIGALGLLASACGDFAERVVVQIYEPAQYDAVWEHGFRNIAYTLYALEQEEKLDTAAHAAFARTHPLCWIAMDVSLTENEAFVSAMLETGVPLYAHTVNNVKISEKLLDKGFAGVYTDIIGK